MLTFDNVAKGYGVRLLDYYAKTDDQHSYERGNGLLVASGAGIMMAVMDLCPEFRWCFDIDANRDARLGGLLAWSTRFATPVAIVGWFSITSPDGLRNALKEAQQEAPSFSAIIYAAPDVVLSDSMPHPRTLTGFASAVTAAADKALEEKYARA